MTTPGFYGKLASRGDFVSRGLPQSFIQPWDAWLAAGMHASQQQLGGAWLDAYLISPLWRFALAPGVCGPDAVTGVLMPSIDRVGRYFPLTVARLLTPDQAISDVAGAADDWFEQVEALLLGSLEPGTVFETFEQAVQNLTDLPVTASTPVAQFAGLQRIPVTTPEARHAALAALACEGVSLWWGRGSEAIEPGLMRCTGLPAASAFGSFLLGQEASS
jgi:type VI secretion system protein ImpM